MDPRIRGDDKGKNHGAKRKINICCHSRECGNLGSGLNQNVHKYELRMKDELFPIRNS